MFNFQELRTQEDISKYVLSTKDHCPPSNLGKHSYWSAQNDGPEMVSMVRNCREMVKNCQKMVRNCQEMVRNCQEVMRKLFNMVRKWSKVVRMWPANDPRWSGND